MTLPIFNPAFVGLFYLSANRRIIKNNTKIDFQVAYIALRADGEIGASAINDGFSYVLSSNSKTTINSVKGISISL